MFHNLKYFLVLIVVLVGASGCTEETQNIPHVVPPSLCKKTFVTPAMIETRTEQVLLSPAKKDSDGNIVKKARYKTQTRQEIVSARKTVEFNAVCPEVLTQDFVTSLQRALAARTVYKGSLTGRYDSATRRAVQKYQTRKGIASGDLALSTAQDLGLIVAKF
jgi:hypothetical protein